MKQVPLTQGYVALVDDADYGAVMAAGPWHASKAPHTVYVRRNVSRPDGSRTALLLHTFLTGWSRVDHVNLDGLDNTRANLRLATSSQNLANMRPHADNTSGFKGVGWSKQKRRWYAQIQVNGLRRHLGYYDNVKDAARAYDLAALASWAEFARPNLSQSGAVR